MNPINNRCVPLKIKPGAPSDLRIRNRWAVIGLGKCITCGEIAECLFVDSSAGEYGPEALCRSCIETGFDNFKGSKKVKFNPNDV